MSNFRPVDRETSFLLPPSVQDWLPEKHQECVSCRTVDFTIVKPPPPKGGGFKLRLKAGLVGALGRLRNSRSIRA